jgi:hypothetical protein
MQNLQEGPATSGGYLTVIQDIMDQNQADDQVPTLLIALYKK